MAIDESKWLCLLNDRLGRQVRRGSWARAVVPRTMVDIERLDPEDREHKFVGVIRRWYVRDDGETVVEMYDMETDGPLKGQPRMVRTVLLRHLRWTKQRGEVKIRDRAA